MTDEQILQAFEGRWRIRGNRGRINSNSATMSFDEFYDYIKGMCLDFFKTGITIGKINDEYVVDGIVNGCIVREDELLLATTFDNWWTLYDKKCGRKDCEKKWNRLTREEQEACIDATPTYVASTPDKKYRKNPLTYLNQKAWNDEIIPNNGTNKPTADEQRISKLASILAP